MKTCCYETYPDMYLDYENDIENDNYDFEKKLFKIPLVWAENYIRNEHGITIGEFDDTYDWDDTYEMYEQAIKENVIISAWVEHQ